LAFLPAIFMRLISAAIAAASVAFGFARRCR
jgi:hypothetical protein